MNKEEARFSSDARSPGVQTPSEEENRSILVSNIDKSHNQTVANVSKSRLLRKIALSVALPIIATVSLFGCQSAEDRATAAELAAAEAAKTKTSNVQSTTPKSNWPKMVTIPAGTTMMVSLNNMLRTDQQKSGHNFTARLTEPVRVDQMTVLPSGTEVRGHLVQVEEPHRTSGKALMVLDFDQVVDPSGSLHSISVDQITLVGQGDKISDEAKVAGGAVIGGVIGAISSNKQRNKGAAVGAAVGAAAGGAIALATKGQQIELPANQHFALDLNESLRLSVTQQTANR